MQRSVSRCAGLSGSSPDCSDSHAQRALPEHQVKYFGEHSEVTAKRLKTAADENLKGSPTGQMGGTWHCGKPIKTHRKDWSDRVNPETKCAFGCVRRRPPPFRSLSLPCLTVTTVTGGTRVERGRGRGACPRRENSPTQRNGISSASVGFLQDPSSKRTSEGKGGKKQRMCLVANHNASKKDLYVFKLRNDLFSWMCL